MTAHGPWPRLGRNLIAILRGVKPDEILAIGEALVAAGFEAIEVPLNSPDPIEAIRRLAKAAPPNVLVGGGTMLSTRDVEAVHGAGGRLLVSPNVVPALIRRAGELGMVTMPGVFTPSEAFQAIEAGASGLKFFPASVLGAAGISAIGAVLPKGTLVGAVGGVGNDDFEAFAKAGVRAFGLGSGLYRPGDSAEAVSAKAQAAIEAYDKVFG
jgi:2-dehydro-3-deoxyphosphogalactonate aldolase